MKNKTKQFKHILIGQYVPGLQFDTWVDEAMAFSNTIDDVITAEAKTIGDIVTIVCQWRTKEAWQRFWEFSRLDETMEELFIWQVQHHTDVDV